MPSATPQRRVRGIFLVIAGFMATLTLRQALAEPRVLPRSAAHVDLKPALGAKWWAGGVIAGAAVLYVVFW